MVCFNCPHWKEYMNAVVYFCTAPFCIQESICKARLLKEMHSCFQNSSYSQNPPTDAFFISFISNQSLWIIFKKPKTVWIVKMNKISSESWHRPRFESGRIYKKLTLNPLLERSFDVFLRNALNSLSHVHQTFICLRSLLSLGMMIILLKRIIVSVGASH
jgi:hypothetical protein